MTIRPNHQGLFPRLGLGVHDVALGNGTQFRIGIVPSFAGSIMVGVIGRGCYEFTHHVHASYVAEKLNLMDGDAANMADFINDNLYQQSAYVSKRQGHYLESLVCPSA